MHNKPNSNNSVAQHYIWLYYCLKLAATIPTQPLSVAQAQKQRNPALSFMETLHKTQEVGLFKGLGWSLGKEAFKLLYKSPLLIYGRDIATKGISWFQEVKLPRDQTLIDVTAGVITASIDTVLSQGVDRAATYVKASHKHEQPFIAYLKSSPSYWAMFAKLAEGVSMYWPKQTTMQTALFMAQSHAMAWAKELFPEDKTKQTIFTTAVTPIFPAIAAAPFDVLKTLLQHPGAKALQHPETQPLPKPDATALLQSGAKVAHQQAAKKLSVVYVCYTLLSTHGARGLFAGAGWKVWLTYTGYTVNAGALTLYKQAVEASKETANSRD